MLTLENKVALVTGGTKGIGAAIVRKLASQGAQITFTYSSDEAAANKLTAQLTSEMIKCRAYKVNSGETQALREVVDQVAKEFGRIDVLVNNAGIFVFKPLDEISDADIATTLDVNVKATYVASQHASQYMGMGGRIINIGSVNGTRMPFPGGTLYAMSKSALIGFTKGLARDLAAKGITVNTVDPGPVDTDMNPGDGPFAEALHNVMTLNRHGQPKEIASFVGYLASAESGFITGANLAADGGFLA